MAKTGSEEYIFETTDPLNNIVYLTKERWEEHIVEIETGHIELIGEENLVKKAVEYPDNIYEDKKFPGNYNYIYEHSNPFLKLKGQYLKVVVSRDLSGQILTAFPTDAGKQKTKPIYTKNDYID